MDENNNLLSANYLFKNNLIALPGLTTEVICNGDANGTAEVSILGGTAPFSYTWSNGETTEKAIELLAGANTVSIVDANDSTAVVPFNIIEPDVIVTSFSTSTGASCVGCTDGNATILVVGGTPPYSYAWNSGEVTNNPTTLIGGESSAVTVTDANNCVAFNSIYISNVFDEISTSSISIYPNPAEAVVYISSPEIVEVVIYNLVGEKVAQLQVESNEMIDVSSFQSGVYLVELSTSSEKLVKKLILK